MPSRITYISRLSSPMIGCLESGFEVPKTGMLGSNLQFQQPNDKSRTLPLALDVYLCSCGAFSFLSYSHLYSHRLLGSSCPCLKRTFKVAIPLQTQTFCQFRFHQRQVITTPPPQAYEHMPLRGDWWLNDEILIPIVPSSPAAAALLNLYPYIHHSTIYHHYDLSPLPAVIATLRDYTG